MCCRRSLLRQSNIAVAILASHEPVLVIADGAAFGSEMERVTELMKLRNDIYLYLPESFEWLILQSGPVAKENLMALLDKPYNYIDSEKLKLRTLKRIAIPYR